MSKKITELTRRDIIDIIRSGLMLTEEVRKTDDTDREYFETTPREYKMNYYGRLGEMDFLSRVYDLKSMSSTDTRFTDAEGDIWQHTVNNDDWDNGWVFTDSRFHLSSGDDEHLLKFLCEMFNPFVRDERQPWRTFLNVINELLIQDGYELYEKSHISGRAVYGWRTVIPNSIIIHEGNPIANYELKLIGEGSYARVYKYEDRFYDRTFVVKRAKKDLNEKELERFKREFTQMKQFSSPYVVEVYAYIDGSNEYLMEFMDFTLEEYINKNNGILTFNQRTRIVVQVLSAFRYIHSKDLLHRDICPKNVLIKLYEDAVIVKVSDFGLVKIPNSELTSLNTEYKGYYNDPELRLDGFHTYNILHETYAITRLVFFIMTGRTNTDKIDNKGLKDFVSKGLSSDKSKRFQDVGQLKSSFVSITW